MNFNEFLHIVKDANDAIDTAWYISDIDDGLKHDANWMFMPLLERKMRDEVLNFSDDTLNSIKYLSGLMLKNHSVFKSGLIRLEEFECNAIELFNKLYNQVLLLTRQSKTEKVSTKMDLYSLRASMQNLNNQN